LSEWNIQVARLTLFVSGQLDGGTFWREAVGQEPENDDNRPRQGMRRQSGKVDGESLELRIFPGRLDWLMLPQVTPNQLPPDHFGSLPEKRVAFDTLMERWLSGQKNLQATRVAFGLGSLLSVPDRQAVYGRLAPLIPSLRLEPDTWKEFTYQINRPIKSNFDRELEINRLTTWGSIEFRDMEGGVNVVSAALTLQHFGSPRLYARCECDVSTPAERTDPFAAESLITIYRELRDLAVENVERGELP
jgi:hypothetical protein